MKIQVIMATAVARLVLTTAAVASAPATAVEAVPAEPQDSGTDRDEQQVVRDRLLPVAGQPRADHCRGHEAGHASRQVNDVTTGEVQCALAGPEAAAPQQESVNGIGKRDPQRYEDHPDLELDPPDHAADEQDRRDRGKHELEVDQRALREPELRHQAIEERDVGLRLFASSADYGLGPADEV
jgi:hypothetical protein